MSTAVHDGRRCHVQAKPELGRRGKALPGYRSQGEGDRHEGGKCVPQSPARQCVGFRYCFGLKHPVAAAHRNFSLVSPYGSPLPYPRAIYPLWETVLRMRLKLGPIALAALAACSSGQKTPATQPTPGSAFPAVSPANLKTDLYAFADDSMQGRETGTIGNVKGTTFIAAQAKKLGLEPAGENGTWFQIVPLVRKGLDPKSTLTAGGAPLAPGKDWVSFGAVSQLGFAPTFTASGIGSVYAGRIGDSTASLTDAQIAGKLVVFSPPIGKNGQPIWQFWQGLDRKKYTSAAGIAIVALDLTPPQIVEYLTKTQESLKGESEAGPSTSPFAMLISPAAAETILGASPASLAAGAAGRPVTANITMLTTEVDTPARNVVAILRGSDPRLRSEYVAIGAHNDHIGLWDGPPVDHDSIWAYNHVVRPAGAESGNPKPTPEQTAKVQATLDSLRKVNRPRLDSINNGADDDGSGSVSVLGIAGALVKSKVTPKRSILFVWHTGEEKGLWGSAYFTDHPTVLRDSIVAQLNIDMVGRGNETDDVLGDGTTRGGPNYLQLVGSRRLSTQLGDLVEKVNVDGNYGFAFDYTLDANGHPANIYCRSDHANYARYGIPVVFFTTGVHQDYHQLTDEPQFIDYNKMARIDTFIANVALAVANDDHRMVVDKPKPDPKAPCKQ